MNDSEDFVPDLLELDKYHLDDEWVHQPKLYRHLADVHNKLKRDLKLAQMDLEVIEAEAELNTRRMDPKRQHLDKLTEATIKALVVQHPDVYKARKNVIELETEVEAAQINMRTADHRKSALENLVVLYKADYWAAPVERSEDTNHYRRMQSDKPTKEDDE